MLLFTMLAAAAFQPPAEPAPPAPVEWAWLNIPGAQGPGARFSFDAAVRRNGPLVEIRLRYDEAAGRPVEARIELDCVARTSRLLERQPPDSTPVVPHGATAPPAGLTTREAVLMHVLCLPAPPAGE
jgi:hypothetical protein